MRPARRYPPRYSQSNAGRYIRPARGFTLVELVTVVVVLGILIAYFAPLGAQASAAREREYNEKNGLDNRLLVEGLKTYIAGKVAYGVLPAPYNGTGYTATIFNPDDTSTAGVNLTQSLDGQNVPPGEINDDGSAAANVRVYQLVTGLQYQTPFELQSGALVNLTYQYGVIYLTQCPKSDSTCNPAGGTGVPGSSAKLTAANYASYQITSPDSNLVTVSSLQQQMAMLATTRSFLNVLQDKIQGDFKAKQIIAAAGDATNFYPTGTTSMGGQTPGTNQGCRDGWYSLPTAGVLDQIQLSSTQYGSTAWAGPIEFCRDYDPLGTKTANAPPHKAALRINANVSLGIAPDPTVPGNNLLITF